MARETWTYRGARRNAARRHRLVWRALERHREGGRRGSRILVVLPVSALGPAVEERAKAARAADPPVLALFTEGRAEVVLRPGIPVVEEA